MRSLFFALTLLLCGWVVADEARPVYVEVTENSVSQYLLKWKVPPVMPDGQEPRIKLQHPDCLLVNGGNAAGLIGRRLYQCEIKDAEAAFAVVLQELGLPASMKVQALLFFNIGVELGQLLFIAAVLALVFVALRYITAVSKHRSVLAEIVVYGVGITGAYLQWPKCLEITFKLGLNNFGVQARMCPDSINFSPP